MFVIIMNKLIFLSCFLLVVLTAKSQHVHFYTQSTGNIYTLSTWGSLPDGSGPSPSSFSMNNAIFHFQNRSSFHLFAAGNWVINGVNSGIVIGNGVNPTNLIVPIGYSLVTDSIFIDSASQLTNSGTVSWNKSAFSFYSTVVYNDTNNFQQVCAGEYGRLNLLGGPTTRFWPDTRTKRLKGNVQVNNILYLSSLVYCDSFHITLGSSSVQPGTLSYDNGTPYGGIIGTFKRWMPMGNVGYHQGFFPLASPQRKFQWVRIGTPVVPMFGGLISVEYRAYWPATFGLPIYDSTGIIPFQLNKVEIGHFKVVTENGFAGGRYSIDVNPFDMGFILYPYGLRLLKRTDSLTAWRLDSGSYSIGAHSLNKNSGYFSMPVLDGEYVVATDSTINVLPLELVDIKARWEGNEIKLDWSTSQEKNLDCFKISILEESIPFEKTKIKAVGNSLVEQRYSATFSANFLVEELAILFEAFDVDDSRSYSKNLHLVKTPVEHKISLFPNPFNNELILHADEFLPVQVEIYNHLGFMVWQGEKSFNDAIIRTEHLNEGMYFVRATCSGIMSCFKLQKLN